MKKIIITLLVITVSFLTYCFYPIISFDEDIQNNPGRILLHDRNGILITDKATEWGYKEDNISYNENSLVVKSIVSIEDQDYFNHFGVDIISKLGALKSNFVVGRVVSGGSTITEQYIKNKYFKGYKRTIVQKLREAFLSLWFTINYNKNFILNSYLNNVYLGNNIYGLNSASNIYFNKNNLNDLTGEEIVILISLINNPGIKSLEEKNYREYFEKTKNRLEFNFERKIIKLNKKENINIYPFVTNQYLRNDKNIIYNELGNSNKTKSTIDSNLQEFTKNILNNTLNELKGKNVTNGAIFAINPKTNEILIYQGSRNFSSKEIDGQVDVIKSLRQPGSTMKPFLYLMALEKGANPDDLIIDLESEYNSFQEGKTYISNNYSLKEYGLVRLKKALGNSFNNATVRLARELGLQNVYNFYKKYGFLLENDSEHYGYSLVLGNPSISLESLVKSYSKLLPNKKDINKFLLYDILSDPDNRDVSFGVNSMLNTSINQAVKTGTSSDFRDNLIVSYHPDLVIGIWIGNNNNSSMIGVTGITGAGYIWHGIVEKAIELGYINEKIIIIPEGIVESNYCLDIKCFRKEIIHKKNNKKYFSNIIENIYSKKDLFENISDLENQKLLDMGFELK